jgi:tRNA A37 methylthiotransferase MiaB
LKTVFIYTYACELRSLDAHKIKSYFTKNNYSIVTNPKDADIIFFIGCSVGDQVSNKSLSIIKDLQKYDAELIVAGCLPYIDEEKLNMIFHGRSIGTKDLDKSPEKMDDLFPENKIKFKDIDDANTSLNNYNERKPRTILKNSIKNVQWMDNVILQIKNHVIKNLIGEHSFFYNVLIDNPIYRIRISWGCNSNCSYCGIKKAIGSHKSKPLDHCIQEFKNGLNKGYQHFALNADDVGAYGRDIGSSFPELLDKMTAISGLYRISIANLSPRWLIRYNEDLQKIIKRQKIIRLGVPIQSGSNRILKLMNRFHDTGKILQALLQLKDIFPKLSLHTHIIIGFPTETEEDFYETLSFIKTSNYSAGQVIPYSCKTGSEAEQLEPKITKAMIAKRMKKAKRYFKKEGYNIIYPPGGYGYIFDKMDSS